MNEETHYVSGAPVYKPQKQSNQNDWIDDPRDNRVSHEVNKSPTNLEKGWVIDIETTTTSPMEPIIGVAMSTDGYNGHNIVIGYNPELTPLTDMAKCDEVRQQLLNSDWNVANVEFISSVGSWLETIVNDVHAYNQNKQNNGTSCLIAHNSEFDILMSGDVYDDITKERKHITNADDGIVFPGSDLRITHKKAGAHGRIYDFVQNGDRLYCPVVDTLTIAKSLWLPPKDTPSLSNLANHFGLNEQYPGEDEEYGEYTDEHLLYCVDDVNITRKLYEQLDDILTYNYTNISADKVYSSASIGKGLLADADYSRVITPEKDAERLMNTFYGGQTWVRSEGDYVEDVTYMDILSHYPTSSELADIWSWMKVDEITTEPVKTHTLPDVDIETLKDQQTWKNIAKYIVEIEAENAKLPVRIQKSADENTRIEWAVTSTDVPVMYHYADVVGAQLLAEDDTSITIKNAWEITPHGTQSIEKTNIGDTKINPSDNMMSKMIERRKEIQYVENDGEKDERTKAHKIAANSLYGISAERISHKVINKSNDTLTQHNLDEAGDYFNPAVASSITAIGRLMLSFGRRVVDDNGGRVVYCDTDSFTVDGDGDENAVEAVVDEFNQLNPYTDDIVAEKPMLEIEMEDIDIYTHRVKKYAIVDTKTKEYIKANEHGLGHFAELRSKKNIKAFWQMVLDEQSPYTFEYDTDIINRPLTIPTNVMSHNTREIMMTQISPEVRYGDFFNQIITTDNKSYLQLDPDSDVYCVDDDEYLPEMVVPYKRIKNIAMEWIGNLPDETTPHYPCTITTVQTVNKENYDIEKTIIDRLVEKYQQLLD